MLLICLIMLFLVVLYTCPTSLFSLPNLPSCRFTTEEQALFNEELHSILGAARNQESLRVQDYSLKHNLGITATN